MTPAIRTAPRRGCPACGTDGVPLHAELHDAVWGAPGAWRVVRCRDRACGALWLDPAPIEEDLRLAYAAYATHAAPPEATPAPGLVARAKRAYLARAWGAPGGGSDPLAAALGRLLALLPQQRARLDALVCWLPAHRPGRLLDVGSGAGELMERMRALGWETEGIEPDPAAVAVARARGLCVREGTLASAAPPSGRYDAVTMRHVIEHVPDPAAVLSECARVLAPGGRLVIETPNGRSWLSGALGRDWRGLEPPRHLQILTPAALARLVRAAGLGVERALTTAKSASFYWAASAAARRARARGGRSEDRLQRIDRTIGGLAAAAETLLGGVAPGRAEEIVLVARQPGSAR